MGNKPIMQRRDLIMLDGMKIHKRSTNTRTIHFPSHIPEGIYDVIIIPTHTQVKR